jgi:hypothetical protein
MSCLDQVLRKQQQKQWGEGGDNNLINDYDPEPALSSVPRAVATTTVTAPLGETLPRDEKPRIMATEPTTHNHFVPKAKSRGISISSYPSLSRFKEGEDISSIKPQVQSQPETQKEAKPQVIFTFTDQRFQIPSTDGHETLTAKSPTIISLGPKRMILAISFSSDHFWISLFNMKKPDECYIAHVNNKSENPSARIHFQQGLSFIICWLVDLNSTCDYVMNSSATTKINLSLCLSNSPIKTSQNNVKVQNRDESPPMKIHLSKTRTSHQGNYMLDYLRNASMKERAKAQN